MKLYLVSQRLPLAQNSLFCLTCLQIRMPSTQNTKFVSSKEVVRENVDFQLPGALVKNSLFENGK